LASASYSVCQSAKVAFNPLFDPATTKLAQALAPQQLNQSDLIDLSARVLMTSLTEPGDRMAGALNRILGAEKLVELILDGLETSAVMAALAPQQLAELEVLFGDAKLTLSESRQRWLPRLVPGRVEKLMSDCQNLGYLVVTPRSPLWPTGLNDLLDAAPGALYLQGNAESLSKLQNAISIVGARNASQYGLDVTKTLVRKLAVTTVSGGALGIDAAAHRFSLEHGLATVAVMAGGLDRKYPRANFPLFSSIAQRGVLISELPPGSTPTRWRFLQRNRLIAALTPTTIVVEAGARSGSTRTAHDALELGRMLYAVPGSVFAATSTGTNALIAEGKAVALADPNQLLGHPSLEPKNFESDLAKRAFDSLRELKTATANQIALSAGLTRAETQLAIAELRASNQLREHPSSGQLVHYALKYASSIGSGA
jgi:DNA processing protein